MFCANCGKEIDEKAAVCPHCGVATKNTTAENDNGGFLWGLLGCCIPIVGLILFLVWKDTKPKTSKTLGIGAIVGVVLCVLSYVLSIFLIGLGAGYSGY